MTGPQLHIFRGLPASGKSTEAKKLVAQDPTRWFRVNRDDMRSMAYESKFVAADKDLSGTERGIIAARDAQITALLKRGINVVVDETCLPQRAARDLLRLAKLNGAELVVHDLTDVPLEECLRRNAERTGIARVPDDVIKTMHQKFIKGKAHPLPYPEEPADAGEPAEPYVPVPGTPQAVMVDLDGTVALMGTRSPFDETLVHEDRPNLGVIAAVRAMAAAGYQVIFCSGRTAACRVATEIWINEHIGVPYEALHMRALGDTRKDYIVKLEIFDREIRDKYTVIAVFDDRDQVVEAWRSVGLTVFQVAPGAF